MKNLIYALVIIFLPFVSLFAQNETLRGDEAIKQLQQTGQYDSLMDAVRSARKKDGQADEPQTEDAIGQTVKLTASDGATSDSFGNSVAISGDTAIVGAYNDDVGANNDQGSAYIFVRSGTVWSLQQQLFASDGAIGDRFGWSVSINGETAIVGAYNDDVGANTNQGSAYVFTRSGVVWTQQQKLTASDGAALDLFGFSVSISSETAIVGAYNDTVGGNSGQGSVYVFVRSGVTWTQQQKLTASDGAASDQFGSSVSISGETAIIAAGVDDVGANTNQGSAYVFTRSGVTWTQQQLLTASDGAAFDQFGASVAISGNNIMVGAFQDNVGANNGQGSAYVFRVLGTTWTQEAQKVAADGLASDQFGYSVSISGDTAIVGAPFDDVAGNSNQGSAYIFVRSGTTWTQQQQIFASDGAQSDQFGFSAAIYGDTVIVGAHIDTVGAVTGQGSAYVFVRSGVTWTEQQKLTASDGATDDRFGYSVAISSNTVIVGAYLDNVGATSNQGSVYVYTRSGVVWTQQAQLISSDGAMQDQFGQSVSIFGNTAVVSAAFKQVGANLNQGQVYVFTRSGVVWTEQQILTASDAAAQDSFGLGVSISGETLVVGSPFDDVVAAANQGSAYVFTRTGIVWTEQQKLTAADGLTTDQFGISVSLDGDTLVSGANSDTVGANGNQGSAYVFTRTAGVWTQQQQITATAGAADDQFGNSVGISGDKIIVGASFSDASVNVPLVPQAANQGAVFIFINNLIPTAANVSIGGRILAADGNGVRNAIVSVTLANGEVLTTRSSAFGYYRFDDIEAGQTVVVSVISKRFTFVPRGVNVADNVTDLDIWAQ